MTYFLLLFVGSLAAAMVGWRIGGARWAIGSGTAVGLLSGIVHVMRPTLFLAENGVVMAFIGLGLPSMLVGLCAGVAVSMATRRMPE